MMELFDRFKPDVHKTIVPKLIPIYPSVIQAAAAIGKKKILG